MASPRQIADIFVPLRKQLADFRDVTPHSRTSLLEKGLSTKTPRPLFVGEDSTTYLQQPYQGLGYFEPKESGILDSSWQNHFRTADHMLYDSSISATEALRKPQSTDIHPNYELLYTPLDSVTEEIRVVFVSVDTSGQLHARIKHISLNQQPTYIALSYVWGIHKSESIFVDGVPIKITGNLSAALRSQAVLDHMSKGVPIWVDAICINQENLLERNTEVLRMRRIYARSKETICWLGKSAGSSDQALHYLESLATDEDSKPSEQQRNGLCELFSRAWWFRVWTIQEAVVPHHIILACGDCHIQIIGAWSTIYSTIARLKNEISSPSSFHPNELAFQRLHMLDTLCRSWWSHCVMGVPLDLLNLLVASRHALATDPRDKVYGILSLAPDGKRLIAKPDYRLSKKQLFSQLAAGWIMLHRQLDILCHAGTADAGQDLPSWVPDWADGKSSLSFCSFTWYAEDKDNTQQVDIEAPTPPCFSYDLSRITIWAYEIDRIQCVAGHGGLKVTTLPAMHGETKARATRYDNVDTTLCALLRTVCGGQISGSYWDSLDTVEFRHALFNILQPRHSIHIAGLNPDADEYIRSWFLDNSHFRIGDVSIGELVSQLPSTLSHSESYSQVPQVMQEFKDRFVKTTQGRTLFTTTTGYLGISRQSTMSGDIAFLVPNCSAPLVLRQTGQSFKLIGDSYIHAKNNRPSVYGRWNSPRRSELRELTVD
ncbi:heterokaryon incompatibility protein-domain-containing protein [Fusarium avenaceum]|nr:heterokaryon incompatibility protein-domain-containing protein [Fusarium avenaceum]